MNTNPVTQTEIRKTQCFTLFDRQRRMLDYYNMDKTFYIAIGKQTAWRSDTDPSISDIYPPNPDERATEIQELIGMQRVAWKKFAKPYLNPTTEEKEEVNTVNYKGLYYQTTNDMEYALANGFTSIMFMLYADRDRYFPANVQFRQVGLIGMVDETSIYLTAEQYNALSASKKGHLLTIENFMPLTRQYDQSEKFLILINS